MILCGKAISIADQSSVGKMKILFPVVMFFLIETPHPTRGCHPIFSVLPFDVLRASKAIIVLVGTGIRTCVWPSELRGGIYVFKMIRPKAVANHPELRNVVEWCLKKFSSCCAAPKSCPSEKLE